MATANTRLLDGCLDAIVAIRLRLYGTVRQSRFQIPEPGFSGATLLTISMRLGLNAEVRWLAIPCLAAPYLDRQYSN